MIDFGLATLGAGAIGAIGSLWGSDKSAQASKANTAAQIAWEREKFEKEKELANTAHQREVEDLEAAGINKIFTVNSGGASIPQMGSITPQMPDYSGYAEAGRQLSAGITTAADIRLKESLAVEQINQMIANRQKTEAERDSIIDDMKPGRLKDQTIAKMLREQKLLEKNLTKEDLKQRNIAADIAYKEIENAIKTKDLKWYEADKIINYILRIIPFAGSGYLMKKLGDGVIKKVSKDITRNAIKNKNNIKTVSDTGTGGRAHYIFTPDGIVNKRTGEMLTRKH